MIWYDFKCLYHLFCYFFLHHYVWLVYCAARLIWSWLIWSKKINQLFECNIIHENWILDTDYYTPRFNGVERGVYWYHLVHLSVCLSVDRTVSALYLQQYSLDPFNICTSYQATSESVSRVMPISKSKNFGEFFKFVTFTLSSFD